MKEPDLEELLSVMGRYTLIDLVLSLASEMGEDRVRDMAVGTVRNMVLPGSRDTRDMVNSLTDYDDVQFKLELECGYCTEDDPEVYASELIRGALIDEYRDLIPPLEAAGMFEELSRILLDTADSLEEAGGYLIEVSPDAGKNAAEWIRKCVVKGKYGDALYW